MYSYFQLTGDSISQKHNRTATKPYCRSSYPDTGNAQMEVEAKEGEDWLLAHTSVLLHTHRLVGEGPETNSKPVTTMKWYYCQLCCPCLWELSLFSSGIFLRAKLLSLVFLSLLGILVAWNSQSYGWGGGKTSGTKVKMEGEWWIKPPFGNSLPVLECCFDFCPFCL